MNKVGVFSYGSLMLKQEIERTLGRVLSENDIFPATLKGFKRDWSAIRENTASTYKWLIDRETGIPPQFIAYLNLAEDEGSAVIGVVFWIEEDELKCLDRRELGYNRLEVNVFDQTGKVISENVFTYIDQTEEYLTEEVYINYHYLNLIRTLCRKLESISAGIQSNYLSKTPLPDAHLANLDVVYFSHDFSQLYELRLDRNPREVQIATIGENGQLRICREIESIDTMGGGRDWKSRLMTICQSEFLDEQVLLLKTDPCFLVRAALACRTNKGADIKTLLKWYLATLH